MSPSGAESKNVFDLDQPTVNISKHISEDSGQGPTEKELSPGAANLPQYTATNESPEVAGGTASTIEEFSSEQEITDSWLEGWRLQVVNLSVCLSLFLSQLETTIVSTSLVSITDDLHGFSTSSWIVTSYLLTYTGFLIIIAKLSDIFGRKPFSLLVLIVFIAFSIGCGFSRDMTTLIVLRAFQGIGGGGLYAMAFVVLPEMVPTSKYPFYVAIISATVALASLLGPLLGGAVNRNVENDRIWEWIFFLNAPCGVVAFILMIIGLPAHFPYHKRTNSQSYKQALTLQNFRRVDLLGLVLLLGASILFVASLEEGGTQYSWRSSITLTLLVIAFILWFLFVGWEWYQSKRETVQEAIFPWRLATDRFAMGAFLNAFFSGATLTTVIIYLPQRFQVVNGDSPLEAGFRLLTLTVVISVGALSSGLLIQTFRVAPLWVLIGCASLQIIGLVLMGYLSADYTVHPDVYGFQVLLGLGFGGSLSTSVMLIPLICSKQDMAVGMGSVGQFRTLGGCVGIAICTNVLNEHISSTLSNILTPLQLDKLLLSVQTIHTFAPPLQEATRRAYAEGYNTQMRVMAAFGGAVMFSTILLWEKTPRRQLQ